jgi:hypothetical protein
VAGEGLSARSARVLAGAVGPDWLPLPPVLALAAAPPLPAKASACCPPLPARAFWSLFWAELPAAVWPAAAAAGAKPDRGWPS